MGTRWKRALVLGTLAGAGLAWMTGGGEAFAADPAVYSIVEGRETDTDKPVLVVYGNLLTTVDSFEILAVGDTGDGTALVTTIESSAYVVLTLPEDLAQGDYELSALDKQGNLIGSAFALRLRLGLPLVGTVTTAMLTSDAATALDDAETLEGKDASFFRNAANLNAGMLDAARFSAYDDLWVESRIGTASTQVAQGDHNHDALYFQQSQLSDTGTLNASTNPVDWTKLKGVPSEIADGDADTTYAAGDGLSLTGTTFSVDFTSTAGDNGTSLEASRGDHVHDSRYFTEFDLEAPGTINTSTNPVDWTKLKGVPAGFADGVDANTTYTNGDGLDLTGTAFSVKFGGGGTNTTAARSDHDHDAAYVNVGGDTMTGMLKVESDSQCIKASGTTGSDLVLLENKSTGGGYSTLHALAASGIAIHGENTGGQAGFFHSSSDPHSPLIVVQDGASDGLYLEQNAAADGLHVRLNGSSGNICRFEKGTLNVARIDRNGKGFFNGGTATSGADFAESVEVNRPKREFEPGDLMVIDPAGVRRFAKSSTPNSAAVAGVYSTKPGVLAAPYDVADEVRLAERVAAEIPLAITGIVPCKVCDEGGAIRAGDLLVSSSVPGHAMKAPANPAAGTVIGKALGALGSGRGVVEILVSAR